VPETAADALGMEDTQISPRGEETVQAANLLR